METDKTFIHPLSDVASKNIGKGSSVWQFCVILANAKIGDDCNICSHVYIENDVTIGNRVTIKNGVQIWDGVELCDDVFIGPNVTFLNDKHPRSKNKSYEKKSTLIQQGASIGGNSTILPGLVIGFNAVIGAGSVVTKDVISNDIVVGNPAKSIKF